MASQKDNLAAVYLQQGEQALLQGDTAGLELFEKAAQLDPCNPELFYRQGLSLFEYGSVKGREKILLLSAKKLKTACHLSSTYFEAFHAWGNTLFLLGETHQEHRYFIEAEQKLKKALGLSKDKIRVDLHYDYAKVWTRIAHYSGEAIDLQTALDLFQQISKHSQLLPHGFWIDYGKAFLEMAELLNDVRLTVNATQCFRQGVALSNFSFDGWLMLARSLKQLFSHTHEEDHFTQTDECFSSAFQLSPYNVELLYEWALFLLEAGRISQDLKKLRSCIEKCQQGYVLNVKHAELIATWAEALAFIGELTDQVDFLYEAQNKITEALNTSSEDNPTVWHSYAKCLYSWGSYFNDFDYYYQAIEKFQEGVSLDRTRHQDWFAIAKVYCSLADLDSDMDACEKAVRFFAKAIDLKPISSYYFEYAYALSRLGEMKKDPELLKQAVSYFEYTLQIQKNALYIYPEWLYHHAISLDLLGDYHEDESYYQKALELFFQVLISEPDFPRIHYRIGLTYCHLGESLSDIEYFQRALHHFRLAHKHEEDNDFVILDWGVTLINIAEHTADIEMAKTTYREAEFKLLQSARLGNQPALYQLGCLNSLLGYFDKALEFIQKAYHAGALPPLEELLDDDWLENLRPTPLFQEFLSHTKYHK